MHKYADMMRGRLVLELSVIIELRSGKRHLGEMGEKSLCLAISLSSKFEILRQYTFLPHDFVRLLTEGVFSTGEIMSILFNLSIERCNIWFTNLLMASPNLRHQRIVDVFAVWSEGISQLNLFSDDAILQRAVTTKVHFTFTI